jgi:hypothetical protein
VTSLYAFVATKTTADFVVPASASSQGHFNRNTSNAFAGLVGGHIVAGDIKLRPVSTAIANHVLCDGTVYDYDQFPDLFAVLGDTFGGDGITTFAVPDYVNTALSTATTFPDQTVDTSGTVTNEDGTVSEPSGSGETGGSTGGNQPSGGRPDRELNVDLE